MASSSPPLTRASVLAAHDLIRPSIHETPVFTSTAVDALASAPTATSPKFRLFFKAENLQRIGAFKIRGATHALRRLAASPPAGGLEGGVCTHSSGNHAQALALAAREAGLAATVVMPRISAPLKVAATRGYGARVVFSGSTEAERLAVLADVVAETGAAPVPPFDHPDIVLGQGTMAAELEAQVAAMVRARPALSAHAHRPAAPPPLAAEGAGKPAAPPSPGRLDAVITPLGGGGMLAGNAVFLGPTATRVFGAEPSFQGADDGRRGLASDPPARVERVSTLTIADGLRTPVGKVPWTVISDRSKVQGVFAATEAQIAAAMRVILERLKLVVEPSAAVPLAVVLFDEEFRGLVEREGGDEGWDVGVVLSGGNVGADSLAALFGEGGVGREAGAGQAGAGAEAGA